MTVTQTDSGRRPRMRVLAVAAAGALAFAGLGVVNAAPATAEVLTATGGSLQWGLKSSLLNYHFGLHSGTTQGTAQGDGATASSTTRGSGVETYPAYWNFPFVSGSYDSATNKYTAQYGGWVALTESNPAASTGPGSASPFKYFKVANPKVVVDIANGIKQLVLDVQEGAETGPAEPSGPVSEDIDFATFPALTTAVAATGGTVTYTALAAVLTTAGSSAFGGFYGEGTEIDPVTASLTGLAGGTVNPPPGPGEDEQSITVTIPEPTCDPETSGDVVWAIGDDGAVTMTEAADQGTYLASTGNLDPISVTDNRLAECGGVLAPWTLSGQVSDFTGSAGTLPGELLGWTPNATPAWITAGNAVASGFGLTPLGAGLSISQLLATINGGTTGTGTVGAALDLRLPVDTAAGSYQAILTLTGLS